MSKNKNSDYERGKRAGLQQALRTIQSNPHWPSDESLRSIEDQINRILDPNTGRRPTSNFDGENFGWSE